MGILHRLTSAKANSADTTLVRPTNWNDGHALQFNSNQVTLCSTACRSGSFDLTGLSGLTVDKPVYIQQAAGPYASKGTRQDEAEMDQVNVSAYVVDANTIRAYWTSATQVVGSFTFIWLAGE